MCIEQMHLIDHTSEILKTRTMVSMEIITDKQVEVGHSKIQLEDAILHFYLEYYKMNKDKSLNKLKSSSSKYI